MKFRSSSGLGKRSGDTRARLTHFIKHDVRCRPILGLYFVIGAAVVGYLLYLVVIVAKDLSSGGEKQLASKPAAEQVQKAAPTRKPEAARAEKTPTKSPERVAKAEETTGPGEKATQKARETANQRKTPATKTADVVKAKETKPPGDQIAKKTTPPVAEKVDRPAWRRFEFPDSSNISYPADWKESEIPAQEDMTYGIRLQVPGADASIQMYTRNKQAGDDLIESLKATMTREGAQEVEEEEKKIKEFDVVELSGKLRDKRLVVTILDYKPDSYFIASLVATEKDYEQQRPDYDEVLNSYSSGTGEGVSLSDIEQSIRKGIQKKEESLIGTMVEITMENGKKHEGVVVAEDDTSYTLENYRYGGRYSFTVRKDQVAKITH